MKRIHNIITSLMLLVILGFVSAVNTYAGTPTVNARNITFQNIGATTASISWINGNGTGRLVVVYPNNISTSTVDAAVTDGTIYTGSSSYGTNQIGTSGAFAVYRGIGTTRTVSVTNLSNSTTYNVKVYEYKNDGGTDPEYNKGGGTNNPRTFTTTGSIAAPTGLSTGTVKSTSFEFSFNAVSGADGYELDVANDNMFFSTLANYNDLDLGNSTSYEVTGLTHNSDYYYRVRAYAGNTTSLNSSPVTTTTLNDATPPTVVTTVNPVTINEASVGNNTFVVTLTFNEDMNNGISPAITFSQDVSSTLSNGSLGEYWEDLRVFKKYYNVADANVTTSNIGVVVNTAADLAGNVMSTSTTNNAFNIDTEKPTVVSINRNTPAGILTNATSVTYTVTFSESVTDITTGDFTSTVVSGTFTNSTISSVSAASGTTVNVVVNTVGNGTVRLDFTGIVTDVAGNNHNGDDFTTGQTYNIDQIAPTVVSINRNSPAGQYTNVDDVQFSVTFSEVLATDNVNAGDDFTLATTGTASATIWTTAPWGSSASIDVYISNVAGDGNLKLNFTGLVTDLAGNFNNGDDFTTGQNYIIDNTAPTVTITRNGNTTTNADDVSFDIDFSEEVMNFANADISLNLTNTATGTIGTLATDDLALGEYTSNITSVAGNGTLGITLTATGFTDLAGNQLAMNAVSSLFTIDNIAPTVTITRNAVSLGSNFTTTDAAVSFGIDFSEEVMNFANADITINKTLTADGTLGTLTVVNASTGDYTSNITSVVGDGTLGITLTAAGFTDLAGNQLAMNAVSSLFTIDNTVPTVTVARNAISLGSNFITTDAALSFDIDFSEEVMNFANADISLNLTSTANGTIGALAIDDLGLGEYTSNITGVTGDGTLGITLESTTFTDLAGNELAMDAVSSLFTIDNTIPTVSIIRNGNFITNADDVSFDIDFSEQVMNFANADISLNITGTAAGTIGTLATDDLALGEYTSNITSVAGDGTLGITLTAAGFTDLAGNQLAMNAVSSLFTIDNIAPTVTITRNAVTLGSNFTTTDAAVSFGIDFSEEVMNFANADITINKTLTADGTLGTLTVVNPSAGDYTSNITSVVGDGTLGITLTAAGFTDLAGNQLAMNAVSSLFTIDNIAPTVTITRNPITDGVNFRTTDNTLSFGIDFSEEVMNFANADISLNLTGTATGTIGTLNTLNLSAGEYTSNITGVANDGTLGITLVNNDFSDLAGNTLAMNAVSSLFTIDNTLPTISSITRTGGANLYASAATISYTVTFSELLQSATVTTADFAVGTSGSVASVTVGGTSDVYTIVCSTGVTDYTSTLALAGGHNLLDNGGNQLTNATPTGSNQVYEVDKNAPAAFTTGSVLTVGAPIVANYYNASNTGINVTVPIATDATLTDGTIQIQAKIGMNSFANVGTAGTILGGNQGGSQTVSLTDGNITGITGYTEGAVITFNAIITDRAGNQTTGTQSSTTITVDETLPSVSSINRTTPAGQDTKLTTVVYTVTFNESVTGIATGDFTIATTGTATGTITSVSSASGSSVTVTVNSVGGDGTLKVNFTGQVTDVAGNNNSGTYTDGQTYIIDNTAPNLVVTANSTCRLAGAGNAFNIALTVENAAFADNKDNYTASLATIGALTVNSVSRSGTSANLNVTIPNNMAVTNSYLLTVTLTDLATNVTTDALQSINYNSGNLTTTKLISSAVNNVAATNYAVPTEITTFTICADGSTAVDFKYIVSLEESTNETVVVKKNGSPLTLTTHYTLNKTTNLITILNSAVANNDVITVELTGTFACGTVTSGNLTVTKNPLPTAAVLTDNSTTNIVCYNSSVAFTADGGNTSGFNYTWEYSTDGGTVYSALNAGTGVVLSGTGNSIVTVSNIAANFSNPNTFRVRSIKANATTLCPITSSASDLITINKELLAMTSGYSGSTTPAKNSTITYTITTPSQGTPTSYDWRVVDASNNEITSTFVVLNSNTTGLTNSIYFTNSNVINTTYYVQVRANGACNTAPWPGNGQGYAVTITISQSSAISFNDIKKTSMNVNWTNGTYDGNILLGRQTNSALTGNLDNTNLTGIIGTNPVNPSAAWGTSVSGAITFGGSTVAGVNYLFDQVGTALSTVALTGLTSGVKYEFRIVDFTGGSNKAARTYATTGAVTNGTFTSFKQTIEDEFTAQGTLNTISTISPNPARDFITFDMNLVNDANVTIIIHSLEGREVIRFVDGQLYGAGSHNINIPLKDLMNGAYAVSISFGNEAIFETFMINK